MDYDARKIKYMNLQQLLKDYKPAYCGDWEEWFKASDPANDSETGRLVGRLCEELKSNLSFNHPIHLGTHDEDDEDKYIANGMHRIAAHHHSSIDNVKVIEYNDLPKNSNVYTPALEVDIFIKDGVNDLVTIDGDIYDDIHEFFSFRLNEDEWVECEGLSGDTIILVTTSDIYTVDLLEELYEKISEMIENSVYKDLIEIDSVAIKLYKWGTLDD